MPSLLYQLLLTAPVWTCAVIVASAGEKLLESFSDRQTFLILLATSWLGLILGWLLGLFIPGAS